MYNNIIIFIVLIIIVILILCIYYFNNNDTCNYIFINDTDKDMKLSVLLVNNLNTHTSSIVNSKKDTIISLNKNKVYDISLTKKDNIFSLSNHYNNYKVIGDKVLYSNNNGTIELDHNIKNNHINNELEELKIINKTNDVKKIEIRITHDMIMYITIDKNSEMLITNYLILSAIYKNYLHRPVIVILYNKDSDKILSLTRGYKFNINNKLINIEINDNDKIIS